MVHEDTATARMYESVKKHAHKVWEDFAANCKNDPIVNHSTLGEGWYAYGTISGVIRKVSRDTTGHDPSKDRINVVRKFLRYSHNVVATEKVKDFEYRIFVRKEWNDNDASLPMAVKGGKPESSGDYYERKVTPDEAGETRPQEPVEVSYACKECGRRFDSRAALGGHAVHHRRGTAKDEGGEVIVESKPASKPKEGMRQWKVRDMWITKIQLQILETLVQKFGGRIKDDRGKATPRLREAMGMPDANISPTITLLADKGLIFRDKGSSSNRRSYLIEITKAGREILKASGLPDRVELPPEFYPPTKPQAEAQTEQSWPRALESVPDDKIMDEIEIRLQDRLKKIEEAQAQPKDETAQEKLDLISSLITDFEAGKSTALKTLGEIQEALTL